MKRLVVLTVCLMLSSCGYHLMGMGRGVVPADVDVVRVIASDQSDQFISNWMAYLRDNATYEVISAASEKESGAELHLGRLTESLAPITYDTSGIVTVDRMTLTGEVSLWQNGERIWNSGAISSYEDIDVSGGPTTIESAKRRIRSDLETQWMRQAWLKLSSGF
jgi:outer membrane lipopolysaccharide assembly protein LptE/RlpB